MDPSLKQFLFGIFEIEVWGFSRGSLFWVSSQGMWAKSLMRANRDVQIHSHFRRWLDPFFRVLSLIVPTERSDCSDISDWHRSFFT